MEQQKIHLPNLNGLRFIAALMVIISHIELNKSYFNLDNNFCNVRCLGRSGVSLFFVLSGFLITFLLLKEKEIKGFVAVKNFYLRRVLRIWPLYYFIILLSLFVFPRVELLQIPNLKLEYDYGSQFIIVFFLLFFFMSNLVISIKVVPFAAQTWSIGTEEQFYLLWPLLINKAQKIIYWFVSIVVLYNIVLLVIEANFFQNIKFSGLIKSFVHSFQLDSLTIGAIGGYFFYNQNPNLKLVTNNGILLLIFFIISFILYNEYVFEFFNSTIYALFFSIIILNLVNNASIAKLFENSFFNYLGKISYGLYMYHQILIVLVLNCMSKYVNFRYYSFLIYTLSILLTIALSGLSYQFLEKPFLKRKKKIAVFFTE